MSSLKDKLARLRSLVAPIGADPSADAPAVAPADEAAPSASEARVERDDAPLPHWPQRSFATHGADAFDTDSAHEPDEPHAAPADAFDPHTGEFRAPRTGLRFAMRVASAVAERAAALDEEADALPGERLSTPHGPMRVVRASFAADHRHGGVGPAEALVARAADVALLALDASLSERDLTRALYLDTETTGLLGGTGTLPFLVGMAWFEDDTLHVEQLFLERPGEEAPMLRRLAERIALCSVIVSFNGKSFDWPLLRTRFILSRIAAPALPPHLDLLHCSRRVFKRRLGSVRLTALEREVLGFERVDDIDGALIPELYLGYLRGRVARTALVPIIDHNRLDLIALPTLLGELARRLCLEGKGGHASDALGFATVSARADALGFPSAHARAMAFASHTAECDVRGELAPEAHFLSGELLRRRGDLDGAVRAYDAAIDAAIPHSVAALRAHLALAKLCEHKLGRLARALHHAEACCAAEDPALSARRIARLRDKLARAERLAADGAGKPPWSSP